MPADACLRCQTEGKQEECVGKWGSHAVACGIVLLGLFTTSLCSYNYTASGVGRGGGLQGLEPPIFLGMLVEIACPSRAVFSFPNWSPPIEKLLPTPLIPHVATEHDLVSILPNSL